MLTGLGNKDGNRANHEVGICLPQFIVNVTSSCTLTVRPKYAVSSYVSLLVAGRDAGGAPSVPLASDGAAAVSDAVNHKMGYYYLDPIKCPQSYTMKIKGAALLSSGARRRGRRRGARLRTREPRASARGGVQRKYAAAARTPVSPPLIRPAPMPPPPPPAPRRRRDRDPQRAGRV